jgi:hypothetical protein
MRWLLLAVALAFSAAGAWMLIDALRHPTTAKPDQLWMGLASLAMFATGALLSAYEFAAGARIVRREAERPGPGADAPFVATYSNVRTGVALAGCVAFAAAGLLMLKAGVAGDAVGGLAIGPLAATVFGGFAAIAITRLWRRGWSAGRLSIDAAGIGDTRLGGRVIGWDEIAAITRCTHYGQQLIEVQLRDPAAYVASLGRLQRFLARLNLAFGFAPYSIVVAGSDASADDIVAAIERFGPAAIFISGQ